MIDFMNVKSNVICKEFLIGEGFFLLTRVYGFMGECTTCTDDMKLKLYRYKD